MPSIDALHAEYDKAGLTVMLVDIMELRETVAQVATARGYTVRVLLDPDGRVSDAYRVQATPTVYLIGRDGLLLGRAVGPRPWTQASGRALLAALLRPASGPSR